MISGVILTGLLLFISIYIQREVAITIVLPSLSVILKSLSAKSLSADVDHVYTVNSSLYSGRLIICICQLRTTHAQPVSLISLRPRPTVAECKPAIFSRIVRIALLVALFSLPQSISCENVSHETSKTCVLYYCNDCV